jgi:hypothetical protein
MADWLFCDACGSAADRLLVAEWAGDEVRICVDCCDTYRGGDRLICPEAASDG